MWSPGGLVLCSQLGAGWGDTISQCKAQSSLERWTNSKDPCFTLTQRSKQIPLH